LLKDINNISDNAYDQIRTIIYKRYGIYISSNKKEFIISRLSKILKKINLESYEEYLAYLNKLPSNSAHWSEFIDSISTNLTYFLRENFQLEILKQQVLPLLQNQNQINIWSAGCSNGSEPYTLKIVIYEFFEKIKKNPPIINIMGTDVSTGMIKEATKGVYNEKMLVELDNYIIQKYFKKGINEMSGKYKVRDILKQNINFKIHNLMDMPFNFSTTFDIIFCRNVLIYFDKNTVEDIVNNFFKVIKPDGYLFLGSSESLTNLKKTKLGPSIYKND
jgi:chemotaxis protein methyltransferase CheR